MEFLEDRRLLTAAGDTSPQLALDATETPSSLIVQYRDSATHASSLAAYVAGSNVEQQWDIAPSMRQVKLTTGVDLASALAAYQNDANVLFAEPDFPVKLDLTPNDPDFGQQWDLQNTGEVVGYAGSDIHAPQAWDATLGKTSVVVAVIDTGVDYDHPDLYQNIWINQLEIPASRQSNLIDTDGDGQITFRDLNSSLNQGSFKISDVNGDGSMDAADILAPMVKDAQGNDTGAGGWADGVDTDRNGYIDDLDGYDFLNNDRDPMDDYFHGTHVAGTIAASINNGIGIAGVAPNTLIMPLKFLDAKGYGVTSDAIAALNYAVANGATISNNSWGGGGFSQAFQTALNNAAARDHIFVAAAGNDSSNNDAVPFYPATYPNANVVSVAATDAGDFLAFFSNRGGNSVDLGAPGVGIYSTLPTIQTAGMSDQGLVTGYGMLDGTSMAAPHVAGVMALVRAQNPTWSAAQVIQDVLTNVDPVPSLKGTTVTGGRLNAAAALGQEVDDNNPPAVAQTEPSGATSAPVNHVHVRFSEAMDAATFDSSDVVSFIGPDDQPIDVISVVPAGGNGREFDIKFAAQSALGLYTLVLGPHIADRGGNELDQNHNGTPGEDPDDTFTATFTIVSSFVFASTDVPVFFSEFEVVSSLLHIDQDLPIADLNVTLNLSFPQAGNLSIWLVSPAQTVVQLSYRNGGSDADFLDTVFDDEADVPIGSSAAPFTGSVRPDEALSAFDEQNARGTWQLFVQNVSDTPEFGSINAWSLDITKGVSTGGNQNKPPSAVNDIVTGDQNKPLTINPALLLANDSDPNGDKLTIVSVTAPQGGTVVLASGAITFAPSLGLSQGSFQYLVSDGKTTSSATVTVKLLPLFPLHNLQNGFDVDNNGYVVSFDVLLIVNWINAYGSTEIHRIGAASNLSSLFYDVKADNFIAPDDILSVVNYINANQLRSGAVGNDSAEGEPAADAIGPSGADDGLLLIDDEQSTADNALSSAAPALLLTSASSVVYGPLSESSDRRAQSDLALDADAVDRCLETDDEDIADMDIRLL
jgi:subtilisin family serine protease/subtilisin-like proprotein convertase family protein